MFEIRHVILMLALYIPFSLSALPKPIDPQRILEIKKMLDESNQGIGVTYKNRSFWEKAGTDADFQNFLNEVPLLLKSGQRPFQDSLYLAFTEKGDRRPGGEMLEKRFEYIYILTLAESYENKNRYVDEIESAIRSVCEQNAWTYPPHDADLKTFNGEKFTVDLGVATLGNGLAQCIYMLDDKLSEATKTLAKNAFNQKMFDPVKQAIESGKGMRWFTMTNNWNSVCLAGLVGAANVLLPVSERAYFTAFAELYHTYGLDGFSDDGYCSEGVGYYNYGFRSLITLRELIVRSTNGKIDLFDTPKFLKIALYSQNIQIINQICPAYSDCSFNPRVSLFINNYLTNVLSNIPQKEKIGIPSLNNFSLNLVGFFPNQAWPVKNRIPDFSTYANGLRSFFEISGVYVGRAKPISESRMGVSFKGGNNDENHNHNDIGSYAVVIGKETIAGDQGMVSYYPADYWRENAYTKYKSKGSYGHPVPLINNKTQQAGKNATGKSVYKQFSQNKDIVKFNITSAYSVAGLRQLTREFIFDRSQVGTLEITDHFAGDTPLMFETALTTRAKWEQLSESRIAIRSEEEYVYVDITASDRFEIVVSQINELGLYYDRIGIRLNNDNKNGYVKIKYYLH